MQLQTQDQMLFLERAEEDRRAELLFFLLQDIFSPHKHPPLNKGQTSVCLKHDFRLSGEVAGGRGCAFRTGILCL